MRTWVTLFVLALAGCAPSTRTARTGPQAGRVVAARLLGARGVQELVVLERLSPSGAVVRSLGLDDGTSQILARTDGRADAPWLSSVRDRLGWRDLAPIGGATEPEATFVVDDDLSLHVGPTDGLAGYATAPVEAVYGASRVALTELVRLHGLVVGPVFEFRGHAVLVVRDGDVESLRVFDLDDARTALDNLEAVRHLRTGDLEGAAALLDRAVARDPASGESIYNLACVHARQGRLDEAEDELAIALALEPKRYARWARGDGDLEALRERDTVRRKIGLEGR